MTLDELGVHAWHIDLPQVHAREVVLVDPPDRAHDFRPAGRELQRFSSGAT